MIIIIIILNLIYRGEEFRPVYKCLGELRSHFYSTPFLMLTGTITENTKTIVMKELQLHPEEVKIIAVTCDRLSYIYFML